MTKFTKVINFVDQYYYKKYFQKLVELILKGSYITCANYKFVNQACMGRRHVQAAGVPARRTECSWFLEIVSFMNVDVCVCVCPRGHY